MNPIGTVILLRFGVLAVVLLMIVEAIGLGVLVRLLVNGRFSIRLGLTVIACGLVIEILLFILLRWLEERAKVYKAPPVA